MSSDIPLTILAGGQSRRMGVPDKCLVPLGGKAILEHILDVMKPQTHAVLINSNSDPALFARFGLPVRPDDLPGRLGPLAGLLTGMRWAREIGASHVATVPADTPFLPRDLIEKLANAKAGNEIAIASDSAYLQPTIGLWPVALAERLERDLTAGIRKMSHWLEDFRISRAEWPMADGPFFNINGEADLLKAHLAARHRSPCPDGGHPSHRVSRDWR